MVVGSAGVLNTEIQKHASNPGVGFRLYKAARQSPSRATASLGRTRSPCGSLHLCSRGSKVRLPYVLCHLQPSKDCRGSEEVCRSPDASFKVRDCKLPCLAKISMPHMYRKIASRRIEVTAISETSKEQRKTTGSRIARVQCVVSQLCHFPMKGPESVAICHRRNTGVQSLKLHLDH